MDYKGKSIKSLVNVSDDGRRANMQLYGVIGEAIDGNYFAQELAMLGDFGFDEVMININSVGGSIVHGFSVLNAMNALRVNGTKVGTYVVGVADSMASIILAFGDRGNRSAASFSSGIIHEPRIEMDGKQVLIDELPDGRLKDELSQMRDSLVNAMASSIGSSKAEVKKLMKAGDIRRTAKELKSLGVVDNVVELTNKVDITNKTGVELMAACSNISPSKPVKMSNRVNKLLGLNAEASEDAQVNAINELINRATDAENKLGDISDKDKEIQDLKAEVKDYKDQAAAANKQAVEAFVDKQIDAGKFQADKREELVAQAEKDFDGFKTFAGGMAESFMDVTAQLNAGVSAPGSTKAEAMLAEAKEYAKHDSAGTLDSFKNKVGDKKFAAIEEYYSDNLDEVLDD